MHYGEEATSCLSESFTFLIAQIFRLVCLSLDGAVALRGKKKVPMDLILPVLSLRDEFSKIEAAVLIFFVFFH